MHINDVTNSTNSVILDTFDSLEIPVFLIGMRDNIISCNDAVGTFLQYSADDISGSDIHDIIALPKNISSFISSGMYPAQPANPVAKQKDVIHYESACSRKDGSTFLAKVSVIPLQSDGQRGDLKL